MQVTEKTKLCDLAEVLSLFEQSSIEGLKDAAEREYGSVWSLTLGQFFECSEGNFKIIGADLENPMTLTAFQYYWIDAFKGMCDTLATTLERMSVPQTPEAKKASSSCLKMSFKESVMVFCREYFGLHDFASVNDLTIDDFMLAKKDAYNKAIFEKSMADIQSNKYKQKK